MRVIRKNWMMRNEKQKGVLFLLLFSIAFLGIYLCTYALFFQRGKSYIWNYDGIKQHFASLVYLGRYYREVAGAFLQGDFTLPMFDFSIGMGEDIMTTLNFYGLGDPLTLLAALVPEEKMEALYNFLVIFRMYLAGLSFAWMCRQNGKRYSAALIGALIYAFSGYALHVAVKHPFFVIPMIFLPLSVVGLERALDQKKLSLLITMVFFTALNGFYFFYMNTIFLVLYAAVHLLCRRAGVREWLKGIGRCAASYAVGVSMAAVIFLPTAISFLTGTRSESSVNPGNLLHFDVSRYLNMAARAIGAPRITWDYLGLVSLVLPALVVLFAVPLRKRGFAAIERNQLSHKMELKVNIIIWTVLMLLPLGGYVMNGFSYVSGRFLYLVAFVYVMGTVEVLPELLSLKGRDIMFCSGAGIAYWAVFLTTRDGGFYEGFGMIMLAVTLVLLFSRWFRRLGQEWRISLLTVVIALNIIGNGWLLFGAQGYVKEFEDAGTALETLRTAPENEAVVQEGTPVQDESSGQEGALGQDESPDQDVGSFYRVASSVCTSENAAMVNGNYGVSSYFSMSNPNRIRYLLEMDNGGVLDSMFKIAGMDGRTALLALASVRYYAVPEEDSQGGVPYGFKLVKQFDRGMKRYGLYENQNFLPLGITFDSYVCESDARDMSGLEKQDLMLKTVVLDQEVSGIAKLNVTQQTEAGSQNEKEAGRETAVGLGRENQLDTGVREVPFTIVPDEGVELKGDTFHIKKGGTGVTIEWEAETAGEYYVCLEHYKISSRNRTYCDITMKCQERKKTIRALKDTWNWYFGREKYLLNMGLIEKEDEPCGSCCIRFQTAGTFSKSDLKLYVQTMEQYADATAERREDVLEQVSIGKNRVSGEISLEEKKLLFLSIPYSEGWRASVDGQEVKLLRADTAYMALELEPGQHQVVLSYTTPYIRMGACMSALGWLAFAFYQWMSRREKRRGI